MNETTNVRGGICGVETPSSLKNKSYKKRRKDLIENRRITKMAIHLYLLKHP